MRRVRSTLFMRLAVATMTLFVLAIGVATLFLYNRFKILNGRFREGTLRSFAYTVAHELMAHPAGRDGHVGPVARQAIEAGGVYALLTQDGQLLAAAPGITEPLVAPEGSKERFFMLPRHGQEPLYGLSSTVRKTQPPLTIQVAFPNGPLVFDTVLEEFVQDIAWIWIPFLAGTVLVNLLVTRIALRPLRKAAQQAELIEPGQWVSASPKDRCPTRSSSSYGPSTRVSRGYSKAISSWSNSSGMSLTRCARRSPS